MTLTISLILALFGTSCNYHNTKWQRDVLIEDISFSKLRYSINNNDTASIITYLKTDTEIDGIPCKAGWIHFTKEWEPKLFCLGKDYLINKVELKSGTWVILNKDKQSFSVVFQNDTLINGYKCKGGGGANGIQTAFYNSGKLFSFFPGETVIIDSIKCKGGVLHPVKLHENGKLQACTLAEQRYFDGKLIKKGTLIQIDPTGKIIVYE